MLIEWDKAFSLAINGANTPQLDFFFYWVSNKWIWIPVYALLLYFIFKKNGLRQGVYAVLFIALMVLCVDQSCTWLFKRTFQRLRPCHDGSIAHLVHIVDGHCGGKYGFLSAHSANFFALATFTTLFFKKKWYAVLASFIAVLTGYSRIYLGVHFLGDVLCGALWGIGMGILLYWLYQKFVSKMTRKHKRRRIRNLNNSEKNITCLYGVPPSRWQNDNLK